MPPRFRQYRYRLPTPFASAGAACAFDKLAIADRPGHALWNVANRGSQRFGGRLGR